VVEEQALPERPAPVRATRSCPSSACSAGRSCPGAARATCFQTGPDWPKARGQAARPQAEGPEASEGIRLARGGRRPALGEGRQLPAGGRHSSAGAHTATRPETAR